MLLQTKFFIPKPPPYAIPRPRLMDILQQGSNQSVTLITAPAGYGKTTLIAAFAREVLLVSPCVWLTFDEQDSAPRPFLRAFTAALNHALPNLPIPSAEFLEFPESFKSFASLIPFLTHLLNLLTHYPERITIILDNYHTITSPEVHAGTIFFLENLPAHVHLLLTSRTTPPLSVAKLRSRSQLTEIGPDELRFNPEEIQTFFHAHTHILSPASLEIIAQRTEGWPAALQLLELSLQRSSDIAQLLHDFTGTHPYLFTFLAEEVFNRQPQEIQRFLLQSSILTHLSKPLCEAVIGYWIFDMEAKNSPQYSISPTEFFLTALDSAQTLFRYHPLFANFIHAKLQALTSTSNGSLLEPSELHLRAAFWYWKNNTPADAMHHALAAEDYSLAVRYFFESVGNLMKRGEVILLSNWLDAFPVDLLYRYPGLVVWRAWTYLLTLQTALVETELQKAETLIAQLETQNRQPYALTPILRGAIATIRAQAAQQEGKVEKMAFFAQIALSHLPESNDTNRLLVTNLLCAYHLQTGNTQTAQEMLAPVVRTFNPANHPYAYFPALANLASILTLQSRLHEAASLYRQGLHMAHEQNTLGLAAELGIRLGMIHLEWNDLEYAKTLIEEHIQHAEKRFRIGVVLEGWNGLSRCLLAEEHLEAAREVLARASSLAEDYRIEAWLERTSFECARFAVCTGDLTTALRWVKTSGLGSTDNLSFKTEEAHILLARIYLARGWNQQALTWLSRLGHAAILAGRTLRVIEIQTLIALAKSTLEDYRGALSTLENALDLAEPEGLIRTFVETGEPIQKLLGMIKAKGGKTEYRDRILTVFQHAPTRLTIPANSYSLADSLSIRELDVLRLLVQGMSDREISEQLIIAPTTVIWHNQNIFRKLGVNNRTQAAVRAREMGLVT